MGRGSKEAGNQGSLIFANVKGGKQGEKIHFVLSKKDADGVTVVEGTENNLSGNLVYADIRKWNYNGKENESVVLMLNDPAAGKDGETYKMEFGVDGSIGRNVMNALLSADNFLPPLKISLWNGKENGYANVTLYLGGEKMSWKYSIEDQSKHVTVTKEKVKENGKIVTKDKKNYLELTTFLVAEFKSNVTPKVKPRTSASGAIVGATDTEEMVPAGVEADDLPF